MNIKGKTPPPRKKLKLPEIISEDLTYYVQFGWKQLRYRNFTENDVMKYAGNSYRNRYVEDLNEYSGNN